MEQVMDKIISEMDELRQDENFKNVLDVSTDIHWDDPGLVLANEYPYIYVAPTLDEPVAETAGRIGYDIRLLTIQIGIVINASDYFNPVVSEVPGSREMVQASGLLRKRLRRLSKRGLDGLTGVRDLTVLSTNYVPDIRDNVFVRLGVTTVTVERQYPHED